MTSRGTTLTTHTLKCINHTIDICYMAPNDSGHTRTRPPTSTLGAWGTRSRWGCAPLRSGQRVDERRDTQSPLTVLLVVLLGSPPLAGGRDLGDDRLALEAGCVSWIQKPNFSYALLLLHLGGDSLGSGLLLGRVVEDAGAVLCRTGVSGALFIMVPVLTGADVRSLRVHGRRVVGAVEELDELGVTDRALLVLEAHALGVAGRTGADLLVRWGRQ